MERFYQWMSSVNTATKLSEDALIICYNECELSVSEIFSDIERALKAHLTLPDCVYIMGSETQFKVFAEAWVADQRRLSDFLSRGTKNEHVCVHEYVFLAWSGESFFPYRLGGGDLIYTCDAVRFLRDGLKSLLTKNNVIHTAPSAHSFKHPSGTLNNIFIQARELASDEAEVFVVSYALASMCASRLKIAKVVYVDTMGIYPFVKNALEHLGSKAQIMSFHAYEKLQTIYPPSEDYFCIVSASTSGGMARQLEVQRFREDCVVTLIDRTTNDRYGRVLIPLDKVNYSLPVKADDGFTLIEIIGENFSAKSKPPKSILISLKHTPKLLPDFQKYFGMNGVQGFNTASHPKKLLNLNPEGVVESQDFAKWLSDEIDWSVSLATNLIIHADDLGSQALAIKAQELLQAKLGASKTIQCVSYGELERVDFEKVTGALAVTVVARDGGILRQISRDLRAYLHQKIPRRFLTPFAIPQSARAWAQLKSFLIKNPTPRDYGFSNWLCLPVGKDERDNAWNRLTQLCSMAQVDVKGFGNTVERTVLNDSLDKATDLLEKHRFELLPTYNGEALALSDGFLFFSKGSEVANNCKAVPQSTVYLTIAAVLQYAREHSEHELRLQPSGYESVVLSPECFLRFNDNILQACFLRACLPSELDYSASPDLSKLMRELIAKIFSRWEKAYGDSALEFAAALAVGTLKLTVDDTKTLLDEAIEQRKSEASSLLGLLLLARKLYFPVNAEESGDAISS